LFKSILYCYNNKIFELFKFVRNDEAANLELPIILLQRVSFKKGRSEKPLSSYGFDADRKLKIVMVVEGSSNPGSEVNPWIS